MISKSDRIATYPFHVGDSAQLLLLEQLVERFEHQTVGVQEDALLVLGQGPGVDSSHCLRELRSLDLVENFIVAVAEHVYHDHLGECGC